MLRTPCATTIVWCIVSDETLAELWRGGFDRGERPGASRSLETQEGDCSRVSLSFFRSLLCRLISEAGAALDAHGEERRRKERCSQMKTLAPLPLGGREGHIAER